MSRNTVVFQDELKQLQAFLVRCMARTIQSLTEFALSLKHGELTDVRRPGIAQMGSFLWQVYSDALQMLADPKIRDDFETALLEALAETSAHHASAMPLSERKQMHASMAAAAARATGTIHVFLSRIAEALSANTCEGLCAIRWPFGPMSN